uniref:Uncharacterized protein n=1 Tax=Rhizophora mucronata TaxID=61149 RepID=A0A2P2R269_RHIMU
MLFRNFSRRCEGVELWTFLQVLHGR